MLRYRHFFQKASRQALEFLRGHTDKLLIFVLLPFNSFPARHMVIRKIPSTSLQRCQIQKYKTTLKPKKPVKALKKMLQINMWIR